MTTIVEPPPEGRREPILDGTVEITVRAFRGGYAVSTTAMLAPEMVRSKYMHRITETIMAQIDELFATRLPG